MTSTIDTPEGAVNRPAALQDRQATLNGCDWSLSSSLPPNGPGQRAVVLLLHGTGGARGSWGPVIQALSDDPIVIAPDLPGHGQTRCRQHGQHGLNAMADDVQRLLAGLGLSRIDLVVGHSAGAAVALWLALRSGQAGSPTIGALLGIAPSLVPPPALYRLSLGPLLAPLLTSMPSAAAAALIARNTSLVNVLLASTGSQISPAQAQAYRALLADPKHVKGALDFMAATDLPALLAALDHGRALPAMACEFLLAPDDHWIPQRALEPIITRHLPSAIIHHCEGGHLLPESQPQRVAQLIEALIARACANGMGR